MHPYVLIPLVACVVCLAHCLSATGATYDRQSRRRVRAAKSLFFCAGLWAFCGLVVLLITTIISFNISRTRLGRAFVAVRDNDLAAEVLGVNLFGYKLRAFFIAAMYAGLAGALRAHSDQSVGTELGYDLPESIRGPLFAGNAARLYALEVPA